MPYFELIGSNLLIKFSSQNGVYMETLTASMSRLREDSKEFSDVTFHCRNGQKFGANKIVLASSSKLIQELLSDKEDGCLFRHLSIDLIFPDFGYEAVEKIIQLIYCGSTYLDDGKLLTEMEEISKSLKLNINVWDSSAFDVWQAKNKTQTRRKEQVTQAKVTAENPTDAIPNTRISSRETEEFSETDFAALKELRPAKKLPFACPHCVNSFSVSFALKNHISKHHKTSPPASVITILNCHSVTEVNLEDDIIKEVRHQPNVVTEEAEIQEVSNLPDHLNKDETETQNKNSKIVHPPEVDRSAPNQAKEPVNTESMSQIDIHATSHQRTEDEKGNADPEELVIELNIKMDSSGSDNDDDDDDDNDDYLEISDLPSEESEIDESEEEKSSNLEKEMQSTLTTPGQKCPLCFFTSAEIKDLKVHLGMAHYSENIIEMSGKFDKQCCAIAGPKSKAWILHMILGHNILDQILPENVLQLLSEDKTRTTVTTNANIEYECVTSYKCHLCVDKVLSSHKGILNHYVNIHFKEELSVLFSKEGKNKCGVCFKRFSNESHLLLHILTFHEPLIGLVPEKGNLEITTFKKTSTTSRISDRRPKFSRKTESGKSIKIATKFKAGFPKRMMKSRQIKNLSQCFKCNRKFSQYKVLLKHIATQHYREDLIAKYEKNPNECNICKKIFSQTNSFLIHLTLRHNVLKDVIPSKSDQTVGKLEDKSKVMMCNICDKQITTHGKLLRHIANVHFRDKIMKTYLTDDKKCKFCGYTNTSGFSDLLGHLATKHRVLEDVMPEMYPSNVPMPALSSVASQAIKIKKKKKKKTGTLTTKNVRISTKPVYKCHICNFSNPDYNFSKILRHIAWKHYREELEGMFGKSSDKICKICNKSLPNEHGLMLHYVRKHDALRESIPAKTDLLIEKVQ